MSTAAMSFASVYNFINSCQDSSSAKEEPTQFISKFLLENKSLIVNPSSFIQVNDSKVPPEGSFVLRGITYKVTQKNCEDSKKLSSLLNISSEECLRIIAQVNQRITALKNREIFYAQQILQERNSTIDIALLLINKGTDCPDIDQEFLTILFKEKNKILTDLIGILRELSLGTGITAEESYSDQDAELNSLKKSYDLLYMNKILELISVLIIDSKTPSELIIMWFNLLKDTNYLSNFMTLNNVSDETCQRLEALTTIDTILFLGFEVSNSTINVEAPYFKDSKCFKLINKTLIELPNNPVIMYYWSFVLSLKSYLLEEQPEENVDFVRSVFGSTSISQIISLLVSKAEGFGVFTSLVHISQALNTDKVWSVILSSLLTLSLSFLSITEVTAETIKQILIETPRDFVENFLSNEEFEKKLVILRAKLPLIHESLIPMLKLTAVHSDFAHFEWKELNTYAKELKLSEITYDLAADDGFGPDSSDLIVLKKELLINPPMEFDRNILLPIPKNTKGKIVPTSSSTQDAVIFMYNYNGWSLLGRILQNICDTYTEFDDPVKREEKTNVAVAIIDLISNTIGGDTPIERSTEILQHLSGYVEDGDIISVLFKTFEQALHSRDMNVLCAGLNLMVQITPNFPHFVWSHLARSDLIDRNGKEGLAVTILGNTELSTGEYKFSILLVKLVDRLVTESLSLDTNFPDRIKSEILGGLVAHLIHIYESFQYWKYAKETQRIELGLQLTLLFSKVLYAVYGIDPDSLPKDKVTKVLAESAEHIILGFLGSQSPDIRAVNSILNILTASNITNKSPSRHIPCESNHAILITESFELVSLLIAVRSLLQLAPSTLEKLIFTNASCFVGIYTSRYDLRSPVIKLFTYLVQAPWDKDLPSLLSYLGHEHASILLESIAFDLQAPLMDHKLLKSLYNFFSAVMEGKQDGLSILFLTGEVASFEKDADAKGTSQKFSCSILEILKKNALKLDTLPESVGAHLLDAIAYAFNTWTAARNHEIDNEFIFALIKRLESFKPQKLSANNSTDDFAKLSNEYKLISRITEILALSIFTSPTKNAKIFELLNRNDLAAMVNPFFSIEGYNKILHENLQNNFEAKWPKLKLERFTTSLLLRSSKPHQASLYDISLMDQFFDNDEKWFGTKAVKGYRDEVIAASINVQFVNNQILAAKSWGALLTSYVKKSPVALQMSFIDILENLLQINVKSGIEAPLFTDVYLERLELCFYILYSFMKTSNPIPENRLVALLLHLMDIIKSKEMEFLSCILQSGNNNYYRPVIRSILILLSLTKSKTKLVESISDQILEFFELVFSKGVNLIISELLSEINTSSSNGKTPIIANIADRIQDLFLLLSLFTKIKELKPPSNFNMVLASSLNEVGTLKVLLNLYSSSHLFNFNEEPIFSDISLTFLSELCSVDRVAEKLITNGLFSVILESPVSVAIQRGNVKPHIQPRLHNIWSNGLLSIILQLLSKFGSKILPECCLFVSYFSKQFECAISTWSSPSLAVSNAVIQETSQIILLQQMFSVTDYQDYLTDSNIRTKIVDDTEVIELFHGLDTTTEKMELSAAFNHLLTHPKYLSSRIVPTTLEEQRLLEDDESRLIFVKKIINEIRTLQKSLSADY